MTQEQASRIQSLFDLKFVDNCPLEVKEVLEWFDGEERKNEGSDCV